MYPQEGKEHARHFYPVEAAAEDSCPTTRDGWGGESEMHARSGSLAITALEEQFGEQAASITPEVPIDVSSTATTPYSRRADACLRFDGRNPYFGEGLIIEVQYRNQSKDIEGTTHDYLACGYSVAWVDTSAFEVIRLEYGVVDELFRDDDRPGYAVRDHEYWAFEPRVEASMEWEPNSGSCWVVEATDGHGWREVPAYAHPEGYSYEYCSCGLRRRYDAKLTRFVYETTGLLAPEIPIEAIRDAIVVHPETGPPSMTGSIPFGQTHRLNTRSLAKWKSRPVGAHGASMSGRR